MTAAEPNCINVGCSHEAFLDPSQIWRVFTDASHELCAAWKRCIVCFQIISKQQNGHKGPACFKGWQRSLCTWSNQAQNSLSRAQTETALSLSLSYMQLHHQAPKAKARQASCERRRIITQSNMRTHFKQRRIQNGKNKWTRFEWKSYTSVVFFFNTVPLIGSVHRLPPHSIR